MVYFPEFYNNEEYSFEYGYDEDKAKECSILLVDEILTLKLDKDQYYEEFEDKINYYSYWNEVKQEIEKL